jgi:hypothetical protein
MRATLTFLESYNRRVLIKKMLSTTYSLRSFQIPKVKYKALQRWLKKSIIVTRLKNQKEKTPSMII